MNKRTLYKFLLVTAMAVPLAACQTTAQQSRADQIDAVLARAANDAARKGETGNSLALLERIYKRDSSKPENALRYAAALRNVERYEQAEMVLQPFANKGKDSEILTEYSAIHSAMGHYAVAEAYSRQAVLAAPDNGQAYHILGISLDAQGHHPQAETAFRKALDHWSGDPSPVLNNLGLNLAAQGFIDEALSTLRKAAAISPERHMIERNIRIVSALQDNRAKPAPIPEDELRPIKTIPTEVTESADVPKAAPVEAVTAEKTGETQETKKRTPFYRD